MATGRHMTTGPGNVRHPRDVFIGSDADGGALIAKHGRAMNQFCAIEEDFFGDVGQALGRPWVYAETGTSTNFTGDFISGAEAGVFRLLHSADNEAQSGRIDHGDTLMINMSKKPRMECRFRLNPNAAAFSADQRLVLGFASAHNATLDSVVTNAWFRIEGANLNILAETDDGTTDRDDQDTLADYVKNQWHVVEIDASNFVTGVRFMVDGVHRLSLAMAALAANTFVQPYACIQKDAGTETENFDIDYIKLSWERS